MMTLPEGCELRYPTMNGSSVVLALIQEKERAEYGEVSTTERSLRNECWNREKRHRPQSPRHLAVRGESLKDRIQRWQSTTAIAIVGCMRGK